MGKHLLVTALVASLVGVTAACYSPNLDRCSVKCSGNEPCPDSLTCSADSFCHASDDTQACSVVGKDSGADSPADQVTLSVAVIGNGQGVVTSGNPSIDCGDGDDQCSASVAIGTSVTLQPEADSDSVFFGWSANCSGDPCVIEIEDNTVVTAEFDTAADITIQFFGNGDGTVTADPPDLGTCEDIDNNNDCAGVFPTTKTITLTATPNNDGSQFGGWNTDGPCNAQGEVCTFVATGDLALGIQFN